MSSFFRDGTALVGRLLGGLVRGVGFVGRGRKAIADGVRQGARGAQAACLGYCGLLIMIGLVTAGFVLTPVGLMLLAHGLLRESVDKTLLGGVFLCLLGGFYVFGPLAILGLVGGPMLARLRDQAEVLAHRIEGRK
jgi:hypothetical protein